MLNPTPNPATTRGRCPRRTQIATATLALAGGLALALPTAALGAKPSYREQNYVVSHDFDVKPGGNLPPLVTTRAFCQAWATTSDPFCFDFDVLPFLDNIADPNFDPGGETKLDCGNPSQNGNNLTMQENLVGPGGTFDFYNAHAACGATFGDANALIIIDPFDGFGVWGPGSSVSGFISSFGTAHADAAGLNVGSTTEAYAFSAAGFKIQGLQLNPDGTIDWLPAIEDTVAGDAKASGKVVRDYDPICYKATNTSTGASASGTLMSSYVEMCDAEGVATWTEDKLHFNTQCGEFEIDLSDAHISPNGYIFFRVEDGEVVESEATGTYAGMNPALGTTTPFSVEVPQAMSLAYDLTPVFDALLAGASPAGLQGNAGGDPDYSEIDLELEFGDAAEDYAAAANDGGADCVGDANGDGVIDSGDLNVVLGEFGQSGEGLAGDLNGDNQVNSADLNIVLGEFGNVCDPDEPVFGACCLNGICVQTSYEECVAADGVWGGIDVLCEDFDPCNPNPPGACCVDGTCIIVPGPEDCAAQGEAFIFYGPGTTCEDVNCHSGPPVGACCFTDGTCVDGIDFQSCVLAPGSDVFHPGKTCAQVDCGGEQPGACCLGDGGCVFETELNCLELGGTFFGSGTPCDVVICPPNLGACCFTDGTCVDGVDFQSCVLMAGSDTFHPGKTCEEVECGQPNAGACCFPDGGCDILPDADCLDLGGFFAGPGIDCDDVNCQPNPNLGACCFTDGTCVDGIDFQSCVLMAGSDTFHPGKTCEEVECGGGDQPGACCLGPECFIEIEIVCLDLGGVFAGPGTTCINNPCQPAFGACCLQGNCVPMPDFQCIEMGGVFVGGPCDPSVCQPNQVGACCIGGGACFEGPIVNCFEAGGVFQGFGSTCADAQCEPSSDCCEPNGTPGCDDPQCVNIICGQDPFCCDTEWDTVCANAANEQCPVCNVGDPGSNCCVDNGTPGCDDPNCQALICGQDSFCCDTAWDQICADAANEQCAVCAGG